MSLYMSHRHWLEKKKKEIKAEEFADCSPTEMCLHCQFAQTSSTSSERKDGAQVKQLVQITFI